MKNTILAATKIENDKLTVIIPASYIKAHPSVRYIQEVIESLQKINIGKCHIILAHDYSKNPDYDKYLKNLLNYVKKQKLKNITIIERETHGHLVGNIRNSMQYVKTEWLLVLQHDLPFVRGFDIYKIINDMTKNPSLKHIRFRRAGQSCKKNKGNYEWDLKNKLYGKQINCDNYTYTRTPAWSDNNHLCKTKYYQDIVLKECADGTAMEWTLNPSNNVMSHEKYGTYIFGNKNDSAYIKHSDGRASLKWKLLEILMNNSIRPIYKITKGMERIIRRLIKGRKQK